VASNNLKAEGAKILAEALHANSSMNLLDISNNKIGVDQFGRPEMTGVQAIADVLSVSSSMTSIDLSFNRLCGLYTEHQGGPTYGTYDSTGIQAIADALSVSTSLNSLK